jgi:putative PIN family toxin of toxin-antitoxin system
VRVFLDTNVLVSAFLTRGLCRDLLRSALEDHEALVSKLVVDEFVKVLREKIGVSEDELEKVLMTLDGVEVVNDQGGVPETVRLEPNDAVIFAAALAAEADVFITGDQGILAESHRLSIDVVSPRRFMERTSQPDAYPIRTNHENDPRVSEASADTTRERAFEFALSIVKLCRSLEDQRHGVLARRLLRAGTSIGANIEEAGAAESRRDFAHKMAIASKEARETNYWLRLLDQSGIAQEINFEPYLEKCIELIRLLTAIVKTTNRSIR